MGEETDLDLKDDEEEEERVECPECGALMDAEDTVCANCGAEFGFYCPECDEEVPLDATVCPHCGTELEEDFEDEDAEEEASAEGDLTGPQSMIMTRSMPHCLMISMMMTQEGLRALSVTSSSPMRV